MTKTRLTVACALGLVLRLGTGQAQTAPKLAVERIASGIQLPVFLTAPAGDTNRVFVLEQHTGRIRVVQLATGQTEEAPFLTVTNITRGGEQGLLGLAFHPNYLSNGWFYVNYTTSGDGPAGHSEVTRFQAQGEPRTSNLADPNSKSVLLTYSQPEENHNGGWVGFGPDGYLYISTGDGGGGNDQHGSIGNGQNRNTLLGKILRIDVDQGSPYTAPETNPFKGIAGQREEIWAFGLRNPWRCSFDRVTGDLWIGDVGQSAREEIDFNPAGVGGLNFGWRAREGAIQNQAFPSQTPVTTAVDPVHDYGRSFGYSVTGGYVYRGQAIPSLQGSYLFADYGSARFWTFRYDGTNKLDLLERTAELNSGSPKPVGNVSSFGEDAAGELYVCDLSDGEIYRITSTQPPGITLLGPTAADGFFNFSFSAAPGQSYVVESRESVAAGNWQSLTNITGSASTTNVVVQDALGNTQRFYRVRTSADATPTR